MYGSYGHRERRRVRYLWRGHPVEEVLHERLSGSAEAVASDGGRTSDIQTDRSLARPESQEGPEPRVKRTVADAMDVSLLSKVADTRYSSRPATGTKSISSTNRVPTLTSSSAHPKATASTCVASTTGSNEAVFSDQAAGSLRPQSTSESFLPGALL